MDREEFEHLKPEEQEKIFHHIPFKERGELFFCAHEPARLTQSLSPEELYLLTREMDLEERSEVIRHANLPQLFFISDIECWKKDRLSSKGFLQWLETLHEAGDDKLLAWLREMDYETVVSGLKELIRVLRPETEYPTDEVLGDEPFFTLDERYFILVKEENIELVRRAVEILFENHHGRYTALLEGVLGELDDELEEEAYQKRETRLAERGFPNAEIAHQIYRPLSKEEFGEFPRKNTSPKKAREEPAFNSKPPDYLVLWSAERLFLDDVLLLFREDSGESREGLQEELAWLSNKVIACQGIDFASEEKVRRGIERARRTVSIGLEDLSGRDLGRAQEFMRERWLEIIFRWGVSRLMELREGARQTLKTHWRGERESFLEFLDEPYHFIFRGLFLRPLPECFDPEVKDDPYFLRDFKNLEEVEKARRAVLQMDQIHEFLAREFPGSLREESAALFSLLGNLFASFAAGGKISSGPISEKTTLTFIKKGFEPAGPRRILNRGLKEEFLNRFFSNQDQEVLKTLWALVFQRLEEELGGLDPSKGIDPRFVSSIRTA